MDNKIKELLADNKNNSLYMIEININNLNLNSEGVSQEVHDKNSYLTINLTCLNLPVFTIQENIDNPTRKPINKLEIEDFTSSGVSCLFTKRPNNFSNLLKRTQSLKIRINKLNLNSLCPEINNILICQTALDLNLDNSSNFLYEIKKTCELLDTIHKPCGTIELFVKISCCCNSIITRFYEDKNLFIFKNVNSTNEFQCKKLRTQREINLNIKTKIPEVKNIVGLSKLCDYLSVESMKLNEKRLKGGFDDQDDHPPMFSIQSMNDFLVSCRIETDENPKPPEKPCRGYDCLMRSFQKAQEFVSNINANGMKGLGLMDPAESPYFNRNYSNKKKSEIDLMKDPEKYFENMRKLIDEKSNGNDSKKLEKEERNEKISDGGGPCGEELCESKKELLINSNEQPKEVGNNKSTSHQSTRPRGKKKQLKNLTHQSRKNLPRRRRRRIIKASKQVVRLVGLAASKFHFGHKSCVDIRMRVPSNMGWLWNSKNTAGEPKVKIGWKPGAISRRVWRLLEIAKLGKSDETSVGDAITSVKSRRMKKFRGGSESLIPRIQERNLHGTEAELPPTIHVHRKDGDYYFTVYPVKKEYINNPELQETVEPLQFKVTRDRTDDDASSVGPDIEFEYSPPIAAVHYQPKTKTKDINTQVRQQEIIDSLNDENQLVKLKKKLKDDSKKLTKF